MQEAPKPPNERDRLQALHRLDVLDSAAEEEFDCIVRAAALACNVPISLISLVDENRQWFKANHGLTQATHTSRSIAFCSHAILQDDIFEVKDALADSRFSDNPLVSNDPNIRFYAGAPLILSDGAHIGTLCVIDRQPSELTPTQRAILKNLARAAAKTLEIRHEANQRQLVEAQFRTLSEASPIGVYAADVNGACTYTNAQWQAIYGLTEAESLGNGWTTTLYPDDQAAVYAEWLSCAASGREFSMDFRILRRDGELRVVHSSARQTFDKHGTLTGYVGVVEDTTQIKIQQETLRKSAFFLDRIGRLAGIGGWEVDLKTGSIYWSDETCRIQGVEPGYRPTMEEAINFYAPQARPVIQKAVEDGISQGTPWDLELPMLKANGEPIWVRATGTVEFENGVPCRLLGAFKDITVSYKQAKLVREVNERFQLATTSGGIGVWERNLVNGALTWNAQMYQLFGLDVANPSNPADLWKQHLHPEDIGYVAQAFERAVKGKRHFETEFRVIWPDGSVHHIQAAAKIDLDTDGTALRAVGVNWDITPQRNSEAELARQHELLRVTMQSIGDSVITTDATGHITWMNPVAERMTGWTTAEAIGRALAQVFHIVNEETRMPTENPVATCLSQGKIVGLANHTLLISRHGEEYGIEDSAAPIRSQSGEVYGVVLVFHDVTEKRRLSGEMSFRATHDELTGLINRAEFETRLRRLLQKSHEDHSTHALMYIDLDQFKLVNDACGHTAGDQLLQQVSKIMGEAVRSRDTLARLGGDEFGVILDHCNTEQAQRVAQQICDRMEEFRFLHDGRRFRIGTSIGLVNVTNAFGTTAAIMQAADTSCYAAKEAGRNRVHVWFDSDLAMRARHGEMQWTTRIEHALDEDRFILYVQRIHPLESADGGLHAEVLLRMLEDGSVIGPGAFLPAAERFNLATRIDKWVLRHALSWLKSHGEKTNVQTLSVNLSGHSVGDRAFHRHVMDVLSAYTPDICRRLCFEITETAAVTNLADASLFIEQVRALGIKIALDDFGAGASSFGYLKTLKVDYLKIDGQFIRDLVDDPLDNAAVRCFVDVAKVMEIKTVAEYVDKGTVLQRITELGIDYAQGYHLHVPEPIDTLLAVARVNSELARSN